MPQLPLTLRRREILTPPEKAVVVVALLCLLGSTGCQQVAEPEQAAHATALNDVSRGGAAEEATQDAAPTTSVPGTPDSNPNQATAGAKLPLLLDLGAGKCIPCKMMAPILDELKEEYAGSLDVVFIDVWQNNAAAEQYRIQSIPTQIFFDAAGKERFRHEGFFSKEDILAKWKELGVDLAAKQQG